MAYSAAPTLPYVWDDHILIQSLGGVDADPGTRLAEAWGPFLGIYFRPLTLTGLALELGSGVLAPVASHCINVGLFLLTCLALMAWLWAEQLRSGAVHLAGAVFATLPIASEAVLWTSARGDLLVVLFAALALRQTALRFPLRLDEGGPLPEDGRKGLLAMALVVALALASKETGVAVAAAVVLRAQWPTFLGQGRPGGRQLWSSVPVLLALGFFTLRWWLLPEPRPPELVAPVGTERLVLVLGTVGTIAANTLWPFSPDLALGSRAVPGPGDVSPLLGAFSILALIVVAFLGRLGSARRLGLAAALYGVFLIPSSNLLPLEIASRTADRYLLLPWLGLALALAVGLDTARGTGRPARLPGILAVGCVAVALSGAFSTWQRTGDWATEESFLRTLHAEADSGNGQPALVYGSWLAAEERCASAQPVLEEAAGLLREEGRPRSEAQARATLSDCLVVLGLSAAAASEAREAAFLDPSLPGAQARILRALRSAGRFDAAIQEAELSLRLFPGDAEIAAEMSRSLAAQLRFSESSRALVEAGRRAGIEAPPALISRLAEAEGQAAMAQARIDAGELRGYEDLAKLADTWGNPELASELRLTMASQVLPEEPQLLED